MKKVNVCILDYGSGNVKSVFNIISQIQNTTVSNNEKDIKKASHLILPGVGAFKAAVVKIKKTIPLKILKDQVFNKKKPFLGICVGMQVLAEKGYEFGEYQGLGWIKGEVSKLQVANLPLPHIGWNNIKIEKNSPLTKGFKNRQDFYFVHSFVFRPKRKQDVIAYTTYGENFCSIIGYENIFGVQFHPEKSQKAGIILLQNFCSI